MRQREERADGLRGRGEAVASPGSLTPYLKSCETIDVGHPLIRERARVLRDPDGDPVETARACFEWVRDTIKHSADYQMNPVTCRASDVLTAGTGYCYAKAHLLAALLRANHIPAGFVYQRLSIGESGPPYCTHGLNAVHLPEVGWYRIDPRGNKPGVDAQFTPPVERLAFATKDNEEYLFPRIYADPMPAILKALHRWKTWDKFYIHLPDIQGRKGR